MTMGVPDHSQKGIHATMHQQMEKHVISSPKYNTGILKRSASSSDRLHENQHQSMCNRYDNSVISSGINVCFENSNKWTAYMKINQNKCTTHLIMFFLLVSVCVLKDVTNGEP